jgi:hypothetical protein
MSEKLKVTLTANVRKSTYRYGEVEGDADVIIEVDESTAAGMDFGNLLNGLFSTALAEWHKKLASPEEE